MSGKGAVAVLVLFVSRLFALSAAGSDVNLKTVETKLRQQMVGKVAVLRNFYQGTNLIFDFQGNLIGDIKTGPWTYYARIEVSSVSLTPDLLIIKGARNVVEWELSASEFENYTLHDQPVRVSVRLEPGFTQDSLASALRKVFLTRETPLSDLVPDYWKDVLTTDRGRRAVWDEKKAAVMKNVSDLSSKISPPRLLSKAGGIELSPTPFKEFAPNNLLLSLVVDANGNVERLQIEKPVGLGLDDAVAETIAHWKWQPAMDGPKPVAVLMYAKALFPAEKGHLDPHALPCAPGPCNLQQPQTRD